MFMPRGATVICIAVDNPYVNFNYFSEFANILDLHIDYVTGPAEKNIDEYDHRALGSVKHPMNANFYCPIENIRKALSLFNHNLHPIGA
jgi:hypothetical protein